MGRDFACWLDAWTIILDCFHSLVFISFATLFTKSWGFAVAPSVFAKIEKKNYKLNYVAHCGQQHTHVKRAAVIRTGVEQNTWWHWTHPLAVDTSNMNWKILKWKIVVAFQKEKQNWFVIVGNIFCLLLHFLHLNSHHSALIWFCS